MRYFQELQPLANDMNPAHITGNIRRSLVFAKAAQLEEVLTLDTRNTADPAQTVCIINPGPSARTPETLAELNAGVDENGKKMRLVLAGAGLGMLQRGLNRADIFLTNHPDSKTVEAMPGLGDRADLEYWIASMAPAGADPDNASVLKHLVAKYRKPKVWHAHIQGLTKEFETAGRSFVGTASGAPVSALALLAALGHNKFRVRGMDGSEKYAVDLASTPAMNEYLAGLKAESNELPVKVGERFFKAARNFWPQTLELVRFLKTYPKAVESLHFSGDTANAAIFNSWQNGAFTCGPVAVFSKNSAETPEIIL